jgi:hypothetical protein
MILAFYVCFTRPSLAALCYVISQGLDAVDGQVARAFSQVTTQQHAHERTVRGDTRSMGEGKAGGHSRVCSILWYCFVPCCCSQCSKFGAVLDMLTDRSVGAVQTADGGTLCEGDAGACLVALSSSAWTRGTVLRVRLWSPKPLRLF